MGDGSHGSRAKDGDGTPYQALQCAVCTSAAPPPTLPPLKSRMNPHTPATMLLPLPQKHCLPPWEAKVGHDSPDISGEIWQTSRRANLRPPTTHRIGDDASPRNKTPIHRTSESPPSQPSAVDLLACRLPPEQGHQSPFSISGTLRCWASQPSPHQLGTLRRLFLTSSVLLSDHEASVLRLSQVRGCQACTRETRVSAVCTPIYGPEGSSGNLPPAVSYPWTMVPWHQSTSPTPPRRASEQSRRPRSHCPCSSPDWPDGRGTLTIEDCWVRRGHGCWHSEQGDCQILSFPFCLLVLPQPL